MKASKVKRYRAGVLLGAGVNVFLLLCAECRLNFLCRNADWQDIHEFLCVECQSKASQALRLQGGCVWLPNIAQLSFRRAGEITHEIPFAIRGRETAAIARRKRKPAPKPKRNARARR